MTEITPILFDRQMARIYNTFGEKNYRVDRIELIWELSQKVWYEDFCKIVAHFISSFRQAPLPKDFSEAIRAEKRNYAQPPELSDRNYIRCILCKDLGMIRIQGLYDSTDEVMRCDCRAGIEQTWAVPIWFPEMGSMFRRSTCPLEWFKPTIGATVTNYKTHPLVREWRERIRKSEKYFKSHGVIQ